MGLPQPRLEELPQPAPEPVPDAPSDQPAISDGMAVLLFCGLALALRALVFPFTQNLYGDAVVRTELAERWLTSPKLITSFADGVLQFGPLHTYVLAAFLAVWHNRELAGRLASIVPGVLTVIPTWRVTQRLFGRRAAIWTTLGFCFWGMHIQMSTTAGSEALSLCLFAFCIDALVEGLEGGHFGPLARSAVLLNFACAVRYDMWMYVPLFGLAVALSGKDRVAAVTKAVMFTGLALVFPLLWMEGNEKAMGDPLYPVHFIDQFHKSWTQAGVAWLGATRFRLWGLVFWPGTLLLTCSPLFGAACLAGATRAMVKKEHRLLVLFALVPTLYFTVRTLLLTFSPLARFTVPELWLCLPFAYAGLKLVTDRIPRRLGQAVAALTVLGVVATPVALAAITFHVDTGWGNTLKPVSPVTTMPEDQLQVAHWLGGHLPEPESLLLDYDDAYTDIGVAFYSNIPEARLVRLRWEAEDPGSHTPERIAKLQPSTLIVFGDGKLLAHPGVSRDGDALRAFGRSFHKVKGFEDGRFEVFRADPNFAR